MRSARKLRKTETIESNRQRQRAASSSEASHAARSLASIFQAAPAKSNLTPATPRRSDDDEIFALTNLASVANLASAASTTPVRQGEDALAWAAGCWLLAQGSSAVGSVASPHARAFDADDDAEAASSPPRVSPALLAALSPLSSPTALAPMPTTQAAPTIAKKRKAKKKPVSWGAPRRIAANEPCGTKKQRKHKAPQLAHDEGSGFRQPRGRPPHDAEGVKMIWDKACGTWKSATGAPRRPSAPEATC